MFTLLHALGDLCPNPTLHGVTATESSKDRNFPGWEEFLQWSPYAVRKQPSLANACEYSYQACNYPQVSLSRKHPLVIFFMTLQHKGLRKPAGEFRAFPGASAFSFQAGACMFCSSYFCFAYMLLPEGMMCLLLK